MLPNLRPQPLLPVSVFTLVLALLAILTSFSVRAQPQAQTEQHFSTGPAQIGKLTCPGGFPTDLSVTTCEFSTRQRLQQWVNSSVTDQAILGAVVYGAGAQIIRSPGEWGRTWGGYGDRVGVRYSQAAARGTAEFLVGSLIRDDPRHLSYKDDPRTAYGMKIKSCHSGIITTDTYPVPTHLVLRRIGHAFLDSVTVRISNACGIGQPIPAFDRLVGVSASAYGGYPWYPGAENKLPNIGQRAAAAYGSTLLGSFYTEFNPELFLGLTKLFVHNRKSSAPPAPSPSVSTGAQP